MDINILQNLDKQRLIVRKLLVPVPICLFSDGKKKIDCLGNNIFFQDSNNVWYSCINTPIPQPLSLNLILEKGEASQPCR